MESAVVTGDAQLQLPSVMVGQCSHRGVKEHNQDALAVRVPEDALLRTKGIVAALADGVSTAAAGREAAESCVLGFVSDYYATPALWSVARSAQRVLEALNRWLYRQTQAGEGHLCTLSLLILRSRTVHLFQVGDSRIWRLRDQQLECLTRDHSRIIGDNQRVLTRVMGGDSRLDVDYRQSEAREGDIYLLTSDGIHEVLSVARMRGIIRAATDSHEAAAALVAAAQTAGSDDNLSCQVVLVQQLPAASAGDALQARGDLPLPPQLAAGMQVDGFTVVRELHASSRSHLYLVRDGSGALSAIKAPSVNLEDDRAALERFVMEGWIGARLRNAHLLRPLANPERPSCLYQRLEYIDGVTLHQWMKNHPDAAVEERLYLADQLLNGVRALHRADVIHADLKPDNIMVDRNGLVRIIDFGSCYCRGVAPQAPALPLGTRDYSAPEVVAGQPPSEQSDLFSVAVIIHELLTGSLPWQGRYQHMGRWPLPPLQQRNPFVPGWVNGVLHRALQSDPAQRFADAAEFRAVLRQPTNVVLPYSPVNRQLRLWQAGSVVLLLLLLLSLAVK